MADELEELWKKLTFTEEEDTGIELDSRSTNAARRIGKYCAVMKILSQRSINIDALRKNLRMLWKPNKGVQISELEEDLYLVEFGDEKDKRKVMDMCPWSYEKQLVLIQEFDGKLTPKEIEVKWALFWVQIYNLPLNCRTRETGRVIGSCLGEVVDVDVSEAGVQWSKCLRVRVRVDVTKRLVRGKRITAEGEEPRWVNFKYERLPNFYYRCGFLNHSLKECSEGQDQRDKEEVSQLQYGSWLRGEPMRRGGKEAFTQGMRKDIADRFEESRSSPVTQSEKRHTAEERVEAGSSHVFGKLSQEGSLPTHDAVAEKVPKAGSDFLQAEGMGKELVGKSEEKEPVLERVGEENLVTNPDFMEGLQWGKGFGQGSQTILEGSSNLSHEENRKSVGPASEVTSPGPLAMYFDDKKGWVAEALGPASKHWKRLARESNKGKAQVSGSPSKGKREGPTPLQELDPNSGGLKRRKGRLIGDHDQNDKENTDGGEAVAAEQHRRAK